MSVLNISGTSFGSISPRAIQSFSAGAKEVAHNTEKDHYLNIIRMVGVIQYGKSPLATLVAEQMMENLTLLSFLRKQSFHRLK